MVATVVLAGPAAVPAGLLGHASWPTMAPVVLVGGGAALVGIGVLAASLFTIGPVLRGVARLARRRPAAISRLDERYPADVSLQAAIQEPEPVDMAFGSSPTSNREVNGMLVGFSSDALNLVPTTPGVADAGLFLTSEPVTIIAGLQLTAGVPVMALTPEVQPLLHHPVTLTDGEVGLRSEMMRDLKVSPGAVVQLQPLVGDQIAVRVVEVNIGSTLVVVTPATMGRRRRCPRRCRPG